MTRQALNYCVMMCWNETSSSYTYDTNDVTRSVLELIDLEQLVVQNAEYGLHFIAQLFF